MQRPLFLAAGIYAQEFQLAARITPIAGVDRRHSASVEFLPDVFDALLQQIDGDFALGGGGENFLCRGHGGVGGGGADVGERLSFGLGDLCLRHLGPAGDKIFHPGLGFGGNTLGLGLGAGNDGFGLALGLATLALELGQQRLGLTPSTGAPHRARS